MDLMAWVVAGVAIVFGLSVLGLFLCALVSDLVDTEGKLKVNTFGMLVTLVTLIIVIVFFEDTILIKRQGSVWLNVSQLAEAFIAAVVSVLIIGSVMRFRSP